MNGTALAVNAWRDGVVGPGLAIPYEVVAPPSRHWLGQPDPAWSGRGGVVFITMDREVGDPLPGGLRALMAFTGNLVTWRLVNPVGWNAHRQLVHRDYRTFHFDRARYEAQIAGLPSAPVHDWSANSPSTSSGGPPWTESRKVWAVEGERRLRLARRRRPRRSTSPAANRPPSSWSRSRRSGMIGRPSGRRHSGTASPIGATVGL